MVDETGRRTRLAGSTPLCSGSTPLSPRANTNVNGANTPATPPSRNGRYTGSPSRQRHRSVTGSARLSASTPKTRTGKREAVNSGARVRGSGGRSGKKRIHSRARALPRVRLQTQVEEGLTEGGFDVQQTQARNEALLRKEQANAEADAEARRKAVSAEPAPGLERQTRGGKRRESTDGSTGKTSCKKLCRKSECGWVPTAAGHQCNRCPQGVVHWIRDMLCTAGHQPADKAGFTHLQDTRIASTRSLVGNLQRDEAGGVSAMLRTYHPAPGQCLCRRDGCLVSRLGRHEKGKPTPNVKDLGTKSHVRVQE